VIIAIDGLKASEKILTQYAKRQQTAFTVYAFRRDELMQFTIQAGENDLTTVELNVIDQTQLEKWLRA